MPSLSSSAQPSAEPSREPSFLNSLRDVPQQESKIKQDRHIQLIDTTRPAEQVPSIDERPAEEDDDSEAPATPAPGTPLYKRLTSTSLQQNVSHTVRKQISNQKYGKYRRSRYTDDEETINSRTDSSIVPPDENPRDAPQEGEVAHCTQAGALEGQKAKKQSRWRRKKKQIRAEETRDHVLEILYENERGAFFFGVPVYSASSLLPSDPRPWQNGEFRTSPVDIRNAQVPDPSWEWAWKSWYVDMSRDVDEEGWEYSLSFPSRLWGNWGWHGNHPWFHSFVRRRRWLRLRRRKEMVHRTKEKAHELTAEYFTIHPKTLRAGSEGAGKAMSRRTSWVRANLRHDDEKDDDEMEILSIADLMHALKKSAVDREKLVSVRKFVANAGEELFYLPSKMEEIMQLLMFQSSRRRLLADLIGNHKDAHRSREDLKGHTHDDPVVQHKHEAAERQAENLHKAVLEAESLVRRLEYWSDVKSMADNDQLIHPERVVDHASTPPDASFKSKQKASDPAPRLHKHPEHTTTDDASDDNPKPLQKQSTQWFDAPTSPPTSISNIHRPSSTLHPRSPDSAPGTYQLGRTPDSTDGESLLDRYATAPESSAASESSNRPSSRVSATSSSSKNPLSPAQKGKEKAAMLSSLDGMMEEQADVEADEEARENYLREVGRGKGKGEGSGDDEEEEEDEAEGKGEGLLPKVIVGSPRSEEGEVVERENA
ncbi:hypothetical protein KC366_g6426 [Hortaea werneckii]|uniref:Peroxin/Ferlin domain-containing protein n=2 Tax=Hortaea werneckii TaxID=91943 RepID=A0A3M7IK15_HORWE|nr:hypothetical protein KC358_g4651 [Hortaea werneckii]OTA26923.1 hypothetical protein BTJ68_11723 [Hortaea werneckii EXF-2000]KAI6937376.1 hypothetical protein KC341_g5624 [Hortaea werneckii]KAI6940816.1 hypothetical protein KC348_g4892 [Hortaea werneckii]KAI6975508.1 hypothetical protein KC321_g4509 [Hortaea werneckii]